VSKSGSPSPKLMTGAPAFARALALVMMASVEGGFRASTRVDRGISPERLEAAAAGIGGQDSDRPARSPV